jgi:acyl transferase domain-containing protein/thioesterase domain-containing protein/acyl carrier protein
VSNSENYDSPEAIAIIGMSGRFPGAKNIAEFWQNLRDGVESVSFFTGADLAASGRDPALLNNPDYVNAGSVLDEIELFDAQFFGINPREAEITDPQQRLFMECAWQALEDAAYDPETFDGSIGVYGGAAMSTYLFNLMSNRDLIRMIGSVQVVLGNDKDHLTTHVSYKLNLKGPSVAVQTACSTSLVAVCLACQSLLDHQCDMALAGGVSIKVPQKTGYLYQEGMINSPDGHCRVFDADGKGTLLGSGVGIVVLKRLTDAMADRDNIYAVIKGSAINNDGALKVGYTAPSVEGQTEVIAMAQAMAGVDPETITYVEAHGTATTLGDPIEIAALTQAFRSTKKNFCGIGSAKSNFGHLNTAAGVAGLIKTALMLKHKMLAPSLHFKQPNPGIDFANSPFYVNTKLNEWERGATPRRAGVSSFGIGGTNAHTVLEEAPEREPAAASRPAQLILLSAKTSTALETATANFVEHLKQNPDSNFADVAYTCQVGRRAFSHRRMLVCPDADTAVSALATLDPKSVFTTQGAKDRPVVFMLPGQGAQYVDMTRELYQVEPTFREHVDFCSEFLRPLLGQDLRQLLYPEPDHAGEVVDRLGQTAFSQPALFVIEYALAQLWIEWGVRPRAMIGHSIGEYVAACLAGVFSLEDALSLIAARGRMMQEMPGGSMLAVSLSEKDVRTFLNGTLDLAAVNGTSMCVVSGPREEVARLEMALTEQGKSTHHLHTSHAFHSRMMDPLLEPFTKLVQKIELKPPTIPFISNFTGTWITAAAATDPAYWARHLRQTIRFAEGLEELLKGPESVLLEVGPGETLSTLVRQHPHKNKEQIIISSVRRPQAQRSDVEVLLNALGRLWLSGQSIDWRGVYKHEHRRRLSLPTYPFERQRYWIEAANLNEAAISAAAPGTKRPDVAEWFYVPSWKRTMLPRAVASEDVDSQQSWLVLSGASGIGAHLGAQLRDRLHQQGKKVLVATPGAQFTKRGANEYTINPRQPDDYQALINELQAAGQFPTKILHLLSVTMPRQSAAEIEAAAELGFHSLVALAQALGAENISESIQIGVVSNRLHLVTGEEILQPEQATILGPCRVIPQEYPNISCRNIDVDLPAGKAPVGERLLDQLLAELVVAESPDKIVAYRGGQRWSQIFEQARFDQPVESAPLREAGVYLITGGLGGIGLALAEYLAQAVRAKLVLVGRSVIPEKDAWSQWLQTHDEQDPVSVKIRQVQTLEALGAEVMIVSADVTDRDQMQAVKDRTVERFGAIHGVIHAAGIAGGGIIQLKTSEIADSVLEPKVKGTLVLDSVLKDIDLDFFVLCSSLASIFGGVGQVDYCSANAFLDAYANAAASNNGRRVVSINWDTWQEVGMAVNTKLPRDLQERRAEMLKQGIVAREGAEVFKRILNTSVSQVAISTIDLNARMPRSTSSSVPSQAAQTTPPTATQSLQAGHTRPSLGTAYVEATKEVEQTIVQLWQQLLGVEQVGIYDDFFELGGHSLLGVQLMSAIEKEFGQRIPIVSLFQHSTVEALAQLLQKDVGSLSWPTLVEIQPSGSRPPLFCVSTPNVNALGYRALAGLLGQDQPVYGLQAQYPEDLDGEHSPAAVEELATDYLKAMRAVKPEGPYQLIGMCRGAHIAYEMARRLEAEGQKIALLGILDTWVIENTYNRLVYVEYYIRRIRSLLRLGRKEKMEFIKRKITRATNKDRGAQPASGSGNGNRNPMRVYFPGSGFVPKTFNGHVSVFRVPRQPLNRIRDTTLGWSLLTTGGVDVHIVPGNHGTVLEEANVAGLAEELKKYLMRQSDV